MNVLNASVLCHVQTMRPVRVIRVGREGLSCAAKSFSTEKPSPAPSAASPPPLLAGTAPAQGAQPGLQLCRNAHPMAPAALILMTPLRMSSREQNARISAPPACALLWRFL